jgi:methionine biosynthesis protein MetW
MAGPASAEEQLYSTIWQEKLRRESDLAADGLLRVQGALGLLDPGDKLLDVGCGEGTLGELARPMFREVHGIDIADDAVRLAREKGVISRRVNLNTERAPYPDETFDTVVTLDVIEHVFDPIAFVLELRRVLRPGGHLVLSTPNIRKIQRVLTLIGGRFPRTSYDPVGFDGGHLHYFTSADLRELFTRNGFEVVAVDGICGDRRTWKYRLAVALLGRGFEKEFLSHAVLIKARKV